MGAGGYGWRSGAYGAPQFGGILVLVLVIILVIWLVQGGGIRGF